MARKHKRLDYVTQNKLTELEGSTTPKCKYCGKSIWYDNTKVSIKLDGTLGCEYGGTSYRTVKEINDVRYPILVCQNCLIDKYPDFLQKNKSRIFNTFNKYVEYAFEIPKDIIDEKNKISVPTLENCIRKHGEEKGRIVYEEYKRKQSYSNSYEYKKQKYGWTKEMFDEYNKSRAVTYKNLIKKHGEVIGKEMWENYLKRQAYTSSEKYALETFGEEGAEIISLLKGGKKEGFIKKYGEIEGLSKYNDYVNKISNKNAGDKYHQSKRGLIFFRKLIDVLCAIGYNYHYYYDTNEFRKYSVRDNVLYSLDFFILELNIDIEFNGNYWHANPQIYDKRWFHPVRKQYAEEIWEHDRHRNKTLNEEFGIEVIEVWEKSVFEDKKEEEIIEGIIKKIEYVSKNKTNQKN